MPEQRTGLREVLHESFHEGRNEGLPEGLREGLNESLHENGCDVKEVLLMVCAGLHSTDTHLCAMLRFCASLHSTDTSSDRKERTDERAFGSVFYFCAHRLR